MSFASYYPLLLLLPLAVAAWRMLRRGRNRGVKFSALALLKSSGGGWRALLGMIAPFLLLAGLLLLIVAAARPRMMLARESRPVDAIAIAMTVDVSNSMNALDLAPEGTVRFSESMTRLAVVKDIFAKFVEKRPDDLIGLVTFGGYAYTRVPPTADHQMLLHSLKGVEVPSIAYDARGRAISAEEQNTAIGDGISVALLRLKESEPASKVIILLSDGANNTGAVQPEEAAAAAAGLGIKIYTIGVGASPRRVPMLSRNPFTGRPEVSIAMVGFDEAQLKAIADQTGGMYFPVVDSGSLESALEEIDKLETTRIEAESYVRWRELFVPFLLAGALLSALAVTLSMASARRPA